MQRFQSCSTWFLILHPPLNHTDASSFSSRVSTACLSPCAYASHTTNSSSLAWSNCCISHSASIYCPKHWSLPNALATSGTIKDPCHYQKLKLTYTSVCCPSTGPSFSPHLSSSASWVKSVFLRCSLFSSSTSLLYFYCFNLPVECMHPAVLFLLFSPSEYLDKSVPLSPHMMWLTFFCLHPSSLLFVVSLTTSMKPHCIPLRSRDHIA